VRTSVSILAVALEVMLILIIVGLTTGIANNYGKRMEGIGADIMVQSSNASVILALNNSPMPQSLAGKFAEIEGVQAVAPILALINSQSIGLDVIYGIDPASFFDVSGGFAFHDGRMFSEPSASSDQPVEILVDDWYAESKGVRVGDRVRLMDEEFTISGIVENGKGSRIFMPIRAAQEMTGQLDRASLFYVKLHNPDDVQQVIDRIHARTEFSTYKLTPMREFSSLLTPDNLPGWEAFNSAVVFVAAWIGVLVIFLSMYNAITERTREIGILRSLGASKSYIVRLILQESFALSFLGVVAGLAGSLLVERFIRAAFPQIVVMITPEWIVKAAIFAVLSGLIGSLYPSLKAAAQDPVEALAYE